jgi:glyoxylase-like metal-dependent hydrolase (beta-lactamase superfamily II)
METVIPGLYASAPEPLPFAPSLDIRSFLIRRSQGNLLVYSTPVPKGDRAEIEGLGGVSRVYANHWHEALLGCGADLVEAPLFVHQDDRSSVVGRCNVDSTFSGRSTLDGDFEVIPTPGHTPGSTAFIWDSGEHRSLFTGDTVYIEDGQWVAAVLDSSDRASYIESLELLSTLDFDVFVPWAATRGEPYSVVVDPEEARRGIGDILERVRQGESR